MTFGERIVRAREKIGGGRSIQLSYRRVSQLKRYIIRVGLSSNSK